MPPSWTDADVGPAARESDGPSDDGRKRAERPPVRRGPREAGDASPLALIEEVFPGKILGFTPAPGSGADAEAESAAADGADPDAFPGEAEDEEDADR